MQGVSTFYNMVNILFAVYACYSWFWQAQLELKAKYRWSVLVWTVIIIWFGFAWNYIEANEPGINIFLALLLVISMIDGATGFASKRIVVSGYFKRTLKYAELNRVLLINVPMVKKPRVLCILESEKGRQYNLQFAGTSTDIVNILKKYVDHPIQIEVRNTL